MGGARRRPVQQGGAYLERGGDTKDAVREFVSAAETALKAVYIEHGQPSPRVHDIGRLVRDCPDASIRQVLADYPASFVKDFSQLYLAPYVQARPIPQDRVEESRRFADLIVGWAKKKLLP